MSHGYKPRCRRRRRRLSFPLLYVTWQNLFFSCSIRWQLVLHWRNSMSRTLPNLNRGTTTARVWQFSSFQWSWLEGSLSLSQVLPSSSSSFRSMRNLSVSTFTCEVRFDDGSKWNRWRFLSSRIEEEKFFPSPGQIGMCAHVPDVVSALSSARSLCVVQASTTREHITIACTFLLKRM